MSTHDFQDHSLEILLELLLFIVCIRILHNNGHIYLSTYFKIHKDQLDIDVNPSFLDRFLEYQTNLNLAD